MSKLKARMDLLNPDAGPILSVRGVVSLLLVAVGIAWVVYYYVAVRSTDAVGLVTSWGSPHFMGHLKGWNYLIGFGLFFLGLVLAAHPSTPLGRGRGVVVGMLGCFLLGLVWICVFYIFSNNLTLAVFNDLGQKNLFVGIAFMAVGFTYATRWE